MNKKPAKADLPSGEGTISTRVEQKQVEDRQAIGANVVYETIRREEMCIRDRSEPILFANRFTGSKDPYQLDQPSAWQGILPLPRKADSSLRSE